MGANNNITLIGRVGKDPETRTLDNGRAVSKFSLAVRRPGKDRQGNEVTDWFQIDLWGKQAELAQELVRKGTLISVCGACNIDEWKDQQGNTQRMVKVNADGFQLLESKAAAEGAPPAAQQRRAAAPPPTPDQFLDEDDIPPF